MFASQTEVTSTAVLQDSDSTEHRIGDGSAVKQAPGPSSSTGSRAIAQHRPADLATFVVSPEPNRAQRNFLSSTTTVCETLSNAVVKNADAAELTRAFAQASRQAVVLLDPECRPIAEAEGNSPGALEDWNRNASRAREQLKVLTKECRRTYVPAATGGVEGYGWLVTPIVAVDNLLGYLLVIGDTSDTADDIQVAVAGYVASMFAVTLARERDRDTLAYLRRRDVLDSLVTGHFLDEADARNKASSLSLPVQGQYRIAVARLNPPGADLPNDDIHRDSVFARLTKTLPYAAVMRGTELVMLVPDAAPPRTLSRRPSTSPTHDDDPLEVLRSHQSHDGEFTFGVSERTQQPEHAPRAMAQAQHAADLGVRLGRAGQTISYEDLGIYRLLLQIGDLDHLRRYARDVLGPLMDYDAAHKPDLLHTLSTYLSQHGSPKQTARMLRVHVNTVSYRIQRIESLTSLDLATPDDRLSAHVAVKIVESLRAGQTDPRGADPSFESRDDVPRVS